MFIKFGITLATLSIARCQYSDKWWENPESIFQPQWPAFKSDGGSDSYKSDLKPKIKHIESMDPWEKIFSRKHLEFEVPKIVNTAEPFFQTKKTLNLFKNSKLQGMLIKSRKPSEKIFQTSNLSEYKNTKIKYFPKSTVEESYSLPVSVVTGVLHDFYNKIESKLGHSKLKNVFYQIADHYEDLGNKYKNMLSSSKNCPLFQGINKKEFISKNSPNENKPHSNLGTINHLLKVAHKLSNFMTNDNIDDDNTELSKKLKSNNRAKNDITFSTYRNVFVTNVSENDNYLLDKVYNGFNSKPKNEVTEFGIMIGALPITKQNIQVTTPMSNDVSSDVNAPVLTGKSFIISTKSPDVITGSKISDKHELSTTQSTSTTAHQFSTKEQQNANLEEAFKVARIIKLFKKAKDLTLELVEKDSATLFSTSLLPTTEMVAETSLKVDQDPIYFDYIVDNEEGSYKINSDDEETAKMQEKLIERRKENNVYLGRSNIISNSEVKNSIFLSKILPPCNCSTCASLCQFEEIDPEQLSNNSNYPGWFVNFLSSYDLNLKPKTINQIYIGHNISSNQKNALVQNNGTKKNNVQVTDVVVKNNYLSAGKFLSSKGPTEIEKQSKASYIKDTFNYRDVHADSSGKNSHINKTSGVSSKKPACEIHELKDKTEVLKIHEKNDKREKKPVFHSDTILYNVAKSDKNKNDSKVSQQENDHNVSKSDRHIIKSKNMTQIQPITEHSITHNLSVSGIYAKHNKPKIKDKLHNVTENTNKHYFNITDNKSRHKSLEKNISKNKYITDDKEQVNNISNYSKPSQVNTSMNEDTNATESAIANYKANNSIKKIQTKIKSKKYDTKVDKKMKTNQGKDEDTNSNKSNEKEDDDKNVQLDAKMEENWNLLHKKSDHDTGGKFKNKKNNLKKQ